MVRLVLGDVLESERAAEMHVQCIIDALAEAQGRNGLLGKRPTHCMAFVEAQRVLCHHVQLSPEDTERLTVYRMCMTSCMYIRSGLVYLGVDGKRGSIDRLITFNHNAVFVHQNQVRDFDQAKVHR